MSLNILQGDALHVLRTLPDASVHCCITSPPYYGLRDYGTAQWEGGDGECDHIARKKEPTVGSSSTLGYPSDGGPRRIGEGNRYHEAYTEQFRVTCAKCGAIRIDQQIGLERTPEEFITKLVDVFREVRRVLRDDGTLWINLGDSYAGHNLPGWRDGNEAKNGGASNKNGCGFIAGCKPKDLIGIPWMLAFALRADGWYLRQDIIWHKPNPMPESVKDRCTKSHEYVFLLSKSARYWYDADAISEDSVYPGDNRAERTDTRKLVDPMCIDGGSRARTGNPTGVTRNRRSVWTLATLPTPEAHFATFPLELPETCLLAGCPPDGVVLDCFCGSATTGLACLKNGRRFLGIELKAEYIEIAQARARKYYPLLVGADAPLAASAGEV